MLILPRNIAYIFNNYWSKCEDRKLNYKNLDEEVDDFLAWLSKNRGSWELDQDDILYLDDFERKQQELPEKFRQYRDYLDEFAYALCSPSRGHDLSKGTLLTSIVNSAEKYVAERSQEVFKELWLATYYEFNNSGFKELNRLVPDTSIIDCIDFESSCFSTTEKMQILRRGYADFASKEDRKEFEDFAISLVKGRVAGLSVYASWVLDLMSNQKPKPLIRHFRWYEQEVYDKLFLYDDWSEIQRKIKSYASCDTMGSEKVAKRKDGEPDNLQTRMERWERVNFRLMRELSQDEWVRVVNNIGSMTESEAEDLYYSFQHKL